MSAVVKMFTGFEGGRHADASNTAEGIYNLSGAADTQQVTYKHGSFGLHLNPTGSGLAFAEIRPPAADSTLTGNLGTHEVYCSFWFRIAVAPAANEEQVFIVNQNASQAFSLRLKSDRKIAVYDQAGPTLLGTGTTALDLNTWYLLECSQNYTAGTYELRIDKVQEVAGDHVWGSDTIWGVWCGKRTDLNSQDVSVYYDDIVLCTGDFVSQPHKVLAYRPDETGTYTDWNMGYEEVDDPGDPDSSATRAFATDDVESFFCADVSAADGAIAAVKTAYCIKGNYGGDEVHVFLRDSGDTDRYADLSELVGTTYNEPLEWLFLTGPDTSAAWLAAGVNGSEIGVKATAVVSPLNGAEWTAGQIHVLFAGGPSRARVFSDLGMVTRA